MFKQRKSFDLEPKKAESKEDRKPSVFRGLFLGLLSGISFSLLSLIVKWLRNLPPSQLALYRYMAMLFLSMPPTVKTGHCPFGPRELWGLIVLRGIFSTTCGILNFTAFHYLSLGQATAIIFSSPVFVTILARIFLKEPCSIFQFLTILVTVIGVVFVSKLPSQLTESPVVYSSQTVYGIFAALSSAFLLGLEYITIRKIKSVHSAILMFNLSWFAILESLLLTAALGNFTWHHCGIQSAYVLLMALFGYVAKEFMVLALQSEFAGPVSTMRSASDIILSFLYQVFIFNDSPDTFGIIGAVLIVLSAASMNLSKWISHLPHESGLRRKFQWMTV